MSALFQANALFIRGKHKEALNSYMDILNVMPDPIAAANVGYMYYRGIGVPRNYKKAISFFEAAAPLDNGVSYFNLSLMYMRGQGVDINIKKAAELMKLSADYGCPNAMLYLGLAYILGYLYDPVEIECISLIPFYQVIYRDSAECMLTGMGNDPTIEDQRYEVLDADESDALGMYKELYRTYRDTYGFEDQSSMAEFMLGKMYIDGIGTDFYPALGYRHIYNAAISYSCAEAVEYLLANAEKAECYINLDNIRRLAQNQTFRRRFDNNLTSNTHRITPMLEGNNGGEK